MFLVSIFPLLQFNPNLIRQSEIFLRLHRLVYEIKTATFVVS